MKLAPCNEFNVKQYKIMNAMTYFSNTSIASKNYSFEKTEKNTSRKKNLFVRVKNPISAKRILYTAICKLHNNHLFLEHVKVVDDDSNKQVECEERSEYDEAHEVYVPI